MSEQQARNHAAFIWSVADLLRGDYKQSEYGRVILPLVVLRRLDCVLEPTKAAVLEAYEEHRRHLDDEERLAPFLRRAAGAEFYNTSPFDFPKLLADPGNLARNLERYIRAFSTDARDTIEKFDFDAQIVRLDRSDLLYKVVARFAEIDLHPEAVPNEEMGYLYEELVRRFSELSNETAGEHFTPREVIRLMVDLLFITDDDTLARRAAIKTMLDPACGTGGMLSMAEEHLAKLNPEATLEVFGQELNAETYAICRSDMMLKGQDASHIVYGNSFSEDGHAGRTFDYLLANPPFGVEWKKVEEPIREEAAALGFAGRFGAGLPRINDGSFLFLQHMISKMKPVEQGGSRLAIVFNGSPLFTGAAGSGESEIRRWIIEHDWLEAVVALPDQLFYNTGISTYFWVVTNRKAPDRRGKVQLVDARDMWVKMRKSLGEKRKMISDDQREEIVRLYGEFTEGERVKILPNESFGFMRITVERPLRIRHEITEETLAAVAAARPLAKLGDEARDALVERLRRGTLDDVKGACAEAGLTPAQAKAVQAALAVRDPDAEPQTDRKGNPEPDPELRDAENVPLPEGALSFEADPTERLASPAFRQAVDEYIEREVLPFVADAWVDHSKTRIGYEIPLTRHFYRYVAPRPLEEIDAEIKELEEEIRGLLAEAAAVATAGATGRSTGHPRRSTNLAWAEDLPQQWGEVKLTLVARLGTGHTPSRERADWWENASIPWITTGEVAQLRSDRVEYIEATREKISELGIRNSSAEVHPAETVVLSRTASAGFSGIMATDMATSQDYVTWTCGPLLRPRFLLLCLRAMRQDLLGRLAMGSTHKTIYMPDIESIRIPLPPVAEQDAIVEATWLKLRPLAKTEDLLDRQLELLVERRQALVAAAVMGKVGAIV